MASSMGTYAAATFASALDAREVLEVLVELPKSTKRNAAKAG